MASEPRFKTILLFGGPGAGKGTQGKMLGAVPGFYHMSSGDMFRALDPNSRLGKVFAEYSTKGELVPDEVTIELWKDFVDSLVRDGRLDPAKQFLLLDGIPRNANQARLMDEHIEVLQILHLSCRDENEMFARLRRRALKENRADDAKEDVIRRRWNIYKDETQPVLDYYPPERIAEIDALGTPAQVLADILAIVAPIQSRHFENALA